MPPTAQLSLILPTRKRIPLLQAMLDTVAHTLANPSSVEVVLVVDADDHESIAFRHDGLRLKHVVVEPGLPMGALNNAGYDASKGDFIMLVNDDVAVTSKGWDRRVLDCFKGFPDGIALMHVNDGLFGEKLCTFPFVTRLFCELAGGICPREYVRYRIDDHVNDIFNLLGLLGERRVVYLPDVVFEHHNFSVDELQERKYRVNDAAMALDAPRFDSLFGHRKEIAVKLKDYVDSWARRGLANMRRRKLDQLADPVAARAPTCVRTEPSRRPLSSDNTRVMVGVVTADCQGQMFRQCVTALKKHTKNFDLVVLDNNSAPGFNHPREMNRIIQSTPGQYLVLLDDDVIVSPGWLDGLLGCLSGNVGVVTPMHKDKGGALSYAGIIMRPDGSGEHSHILTPATQPRRIVTMCSAALLIDLAKCRNVLFDETYHKYFLDIDYGLQIWEAGFEVVCAPNSVVTHLGGFTVSQQMAMVRIAERWVADRDTFVRRWMVGDRFKKLASRISVAFPEMQMFVDLSVEAQNVLRLEPGESLKEHRVRAERVFKGLRCLPALKQIVERGATEVLGERVPDLWDPEVGHVSWILGLCGRPVVVDDNFQGLRIVLCERFYAVRAGERDFDLQRERANGTLLFGADRLDRLKERIRRGLASRRDDSLRVMGPWTTLREIRMPSVERRRQVQLLAEAMRDVAADMQRVASAPRGFAAEVLESPNYQGYVIVRRQDDYRALHLPSTAAPGKVSGAGSLFASSEQEIKRLIDAATAEFVERYRDYAVYRYEGTFLALPHDLEVCVPEDIVVAAQDKGAVGDTLAEIHGAVDSLWARPRNETTRPQNVPA